MRKDNLYRNVAIRYAEMANTLYTRSYNMPICYEREVLRIKAHRYTIKAGTLSQKAFFESIKYSK